MAPLFRRLSNIHCFFCNSSILSPHNTRNFQCPACGCWNRYNDHGEIISDEPAMHEEHLNRVNFAKRASPSKDQLPNIQRSGLFCHNCQTNQMLIMNLLSNYLPPPESPEYEQRLRTLPNYKESLYERYPPVCDTCRPAVEEEIQNKEQMARRKALNGWLKGGKERQRRVSGMPATKEKNINMSIHWRIRGFLWFASSLTSISFLVLHLLDNSTSSQILQYLSFPLPLLIIISLLWTAWDPTYITAQKAQLHGRDVRIRGKQKYIVCQMAAWFSRLIFSLVLACSRRGIHPVPSFLTRPYLYLPIALSVELLALLGYPLFLRVQHPPPIRLIDTHSHLNVLSRSETPATSTSQSSTPTTATFPKITEQDFLASLSLSSKPVLTPPKPVFGLPSLGASTSAPTLIKPKVEDEDAMDWSPTDEEPGSKWKVKKERDDNSSWLRPQRFFAPEKPTGLENILARTRLEDDDVMQVDQVPTRSNVPSLFNNSIYWFLPVVITTISMGLAYVAFWLVKNR